MQQKFSNNCSYEARWASAAESERQKAAQRLRHIQKMELIGRYAGGIVHDLNNILTVIVSNSQLLLDHPEVGTSAGQRVQQILDAGFRAANLTSQLLAFSRKQIARPIPLDLNQVIREHVNMIEFLMGSGIELQTRLESGLSHVNADRGQMEQVLVNLCVNARDAMPHGGQILVESKNVDIAEDHLLNRQFSVKPGRYVQFSVSDTGIGMDLATLQRIFEPFFTTKPPDKGMGLGLATVQSIVKHACGHVWVESEPGQGSVLSVYLPALAKSARRHEDYAFLEKIRGSETILLVEDQASLRASLSETLRNLGYTVLEAEDAECAEQIAHRHKDIALALIDIDLPGTTGLTLTTNLRTLRTGLKVLQLTAPASGFVNHGLRQEGNDFVQKPFTPRAIAEKLRQLLDNLA
ncbi:MAG TPA: ATP-binding protein [Candidatus Acidoferrum sp.]|nr:ATP-binding protein [Candidatus Acidoferrum sp.]